MTLAAGGLLYFLAVSLVDHWLIPGGLGIGGRVFFFVLFLLAAAWYIARRLAPLVIRRINRISLPINELQPPINRRTMEFVGARENRDISPPLGARHPGER